MTLENKTTIEIDNDTLLYQQNLSTTINKSNIFLILFFTFLILFVSVIYTILENFDWAPLLNLKKFKRIKKNMNLWTDIMEEKTGIEINKGKLLYLTNPQVAEFQCLDYGDYYVPGRLSNTSYLPEFIRRGNSGPWIIQKANKSDPSAQQFCKYLLNKYIISSQNNSDNVITCGIDMFNKLGYGGYFISNSPCEKAIEILNEKHT